MTVPVTSHGFGRDICIAGILKLAKSGRTVASDWFDGLKTGRAFTDDRAQQGTLLYSGDETYSREGVTVTGWRKAGQLHIT
jgi:hypothetical protein